GSPTLAAAAGVGAASSSLFFVSSRRRHTRPTRDWSSDVCSSDLRKRIGTSFTLLWGNKDRLPGATLPRSAGNLFQVEAGKAQRRSEERRVGKECRNAWARSR